MKKKKSVQLNDSSGSTKKTFFPNGIEIHGDRKTICAFEKALSGFFDKSKIKFVIK